MVNIRWKESNLTFLTSIGFIHYSSLGRPPFLNTAADYDPRRKITSVWHRVAVGDTFADSLKRPKQWSSSSSIAAHPLAPLYAIFSECNMSSCIDYDGPMTKLSSLEHEIVQHNYQDERARVAKDLFAMNFQDLIRGLNRISSWIMTMEMSCEYLIESLQHVSKRLEDDSISRGVHGSTYVQYKSQVNLLNSSQKLLLKQLQYAQRRAQMQLTVVGARYAYVEMWKF